MFVVATYAFVVSVVALLLWSLEAMQGNDDHRNIDATYLFAGAITLPFFFAFVNVGRRS